MAKKPLMRCTWPGEDARMIDYHDTVWGTPEHDDVKLYAKLGFRPLCAPLGVGRARTGEPPRRYRRA